MSTLKENEHDVLSSLPDLGEPDFVVECTQPAVNGGAKKEKRHSVVSSTDAFLEKIDKREDIQDILRRLAK